MDWLKQRRCLARSFCPAVSSLSCLVALLMPTPAQVCSVPTTPMHRRSLSPLPHRPTTSRLTARPIGGARTGPCSVTPVGAQSGGTGRRRQRVHGSPQGSGPPGRVPLLARAGVQCRPLTRRAAQPLLCLSARPLPSPPLPGVPPLPSQLPCPTSPQPHIATHGRRRPGDAMGGAPPPGTRCTTTPGLVAGKAFVHLCSSSSGGGHTHSTGRGVRNPSCERIGSWTS